MIRPLALGAALGLAALAQPALACRIAAPPPALPSLTWTSAPTDLRPGEVVLEVVFEREANPPLPIMPPPKNGEDIIVISSCGPPPFHRFRVVRALVGEFPADSVLVMGSHYDGSQAADGPRLLVGSMVPYAQAASPGTTFDPPEVFRPRYAPQ